MEGEGHEAMTSDGDNGFVIAHDDVRLVCMVKVGDALEHCLV